MKCIQRLGLAALAASLWLAAPAQSDIPEAQTAKWTPDAGDQIAFEVLRNGNDFGRHIVRFDRADDGDLLVETEVFLRAGLGPITLFKYELGTNERWEDGTLVFLEGAVNDDGSRESVLAETQDGRLVVDGDMFAGEVELGLLPASHWNIEQTQATQLLSSENGEVLNVVVEPEGRETIEAGGEVLEANRFLMDSDIDVTLWYDDAGRWVKLAFEARGQSIEYVLESLY